MYSDISVKDYAIYHIAHTHHHIAILIEKLDSSNSLKCVSTGKKLIWKELTNNSWKPILHDFELHERLISKAALFINKIKNDIIKTIRTDSDEHEYMMNRYKLLMSILHSLDQKGFRNNVIKECEILFCPQSDIIDTSV
jgi:hypothetical protein